MPMTFPPAKLQQIKESTEIYKHEVTTLNTLIHQETDDNHLDMLYYLSAISTIKHCNRIGLLDAEEMEESYMEALGEEVSRYFPHKDDSELFDDIAVLEEDVKSGFFDDPEGSKKRLLDALKITL